MEPEGLHGTSRMTGLPDDEYYRQYIEVARSHWWFRGREQVVATVARPLVQVPPGGLVVDVGSGPGGPTRTIFPARRIVALDLSARVLHAYPGADGCVVADAARLPCRPGSVAVVCAFDVLEHLDDDAMALREWQRALTSGGWLVVTVPAYRQLWSAHDELNHHRRRYTASALRRLLFRAGFDVARLTYFNTLLLPGVALVRWMERFRGSSRVTRGELDCQRQLPAWLVRCCEGALWVEATWLRRHVLPVGVSICAVARVSAANRIRC